CVQHRERLSLLEELLFFALQVGVPLLEPRSLHTLRALLFVLADELAIELLLDRLTLHQPRLHALQLALRGRQAGARGFQAELDGRDRGPGALTQPGDELTIRRDREVHIKTVLASLL